MLPVLLAALLVTGWFAWKGNARFDLLDWALVAYATAWLLAGLAAPWDFPAALREALALVAGSLLCLCLRSAIPARGRAGIAAAAVVAGVVAAVIARPSPPPMPRSDLAAAARTAFSQQRVFGWGPGQFRQWTFRWLAAGPQDASADPPDLYLHHLADGGIVAAVALAFLVLAAATVLVPPARGRRPDRAARVGLAGLVLWLLGGLAVSPLLLAGPTLALWVALGVAAAKRPGSQ